MIEIGLCLFSFASTVASLETGHWFATPFAMLFTFGYGYVAALVAAEQVARRRASTRVALAGAATPESVPPSAPAATEELAA
jgi:hypothetical protein